MIPMDPAMNSDDTKRVEEIRKALEDADVKVTDIDVSLDGPMMELDIQAYTTR